MTKEEIKAFVRKNGWAHLSRVYSLLYVIDYHPLGNILPWFIWRIWDKIMLNYHFYRLRIWKWF